MYKKILAVLLAVALAFVSFGELAAFADAFDAFEVYCKREDYPQTHEGLMQYLYDTKEAVNKYDDVSYVDWLEMLGNGDLGTAFRVALDNSPLSPSKSLLNDVLDQMIADELGDHHGGGGLRNSLLPNNDDVKLVNTADEVKFSDGSKLILYATTYGIFPADDAHRGKRFMNVSFDVSYVDKSGTISRIQNPFHYSLTICDENHNHFNETSYPAANVELMFKSFEPKLDVVALGNDSFSWSAQLSFEYVTYASGIGWTNVPKTDKATGNFKLPSASSGAEMLPGQNTINFNNYVGGTVITNEGDTYNVYYGVDDDGTPCVYDEQGNRYYYNDDHSITMGDNKFYIKPNYNSFSDDQITTIFNAYSDMINYYYNNGYTFADDIDYSYNFGGGSTGGTVDNGVLRNILVYVRSIRTNLINFYNKVLGYLEKILNLLTPHTPTEDDPDNPEEPEFDMNIEIQDLPKMIYDKINPASYFKQLNNMLGILFGSDYKSDITDDYFDITKYLKTDEETQEQSLEMTTADLPEVYGEELAEADINIADSAYLTQAAIDAHSSIGSYLAVPPKLSFQYEGVTYDLFEFLTPEIYDKIRPLKEFIRLILIISWSFWSIKFVISIVANNADTIGSELSWRSLNK